MQIFDTSNIVSYHLSYPKVLKIEGLYNTSLGGAHSRDNSNAFQQLLPLWK
jgi:hypothetical protein